MKFTFIDTIKKYIKLIIAYPNYNSIFRRINKEKNEKCAILIGTPIHSNLGDHLIGKQCIDFIRKLPYKEIIEVPEFVYELFPNKFRIGKETDIYISGGGWMGNLYEDELVIEDILYRFRYNRIFVLPQTIFFSNDGKYSSVEQMYKAIKGASNIYFCLRDENSYNLCVNQLKISEKRCLLLPDMALLGLSQIRKNTHLNKKKIILALRKDAERRVQMDSIQSLVNKLTEHGYIFKESSTIAKEKIIKVDRRETIMEDKLEEFSECALVITDRLHSMVFSLIAGTKCIAFDNKTHKVTGIYRSWISSMPGLAVYDSVADVSENDILKMLNSDLFPEKIDLMYKFHNLINIIEEGLK